MPHIVAKRRYTFRRRRLWVPSNPPVVGGTAVAVFFHHLATQGDDKIIMLRQSTASQEILLGPFVDSTDGNTAETALTIANTDIKIFKDGATTLADKNSGGATHISNGYYSAVLDATDTNTVGQLEVHVKVAGALAVMRKYQVVEEAVYDALFASSAAGYQVPIWAAANSTVNLSGTTVATVTTTTNVTTVNGLADNIITAAKINDGAFTAAKFASGAFDAVWSVTTRTLTSISGLGIALATKLTKYVQLLARKDSAIATDNATEVTEINANGGSGAGAFANTTDALEALRDNAGTNGAAYVFGSGALANISTWTVDITGNITGNVTGSVGSVTNPVTVTGDCATAGTRFLTMIELDGSVYRYTTNSLEQAPSGGGGTDWTADERTALRAILGIPASGTTPEDPTAGILDTIRDDTNELQTDWANGGRLDNILDARASQTSVDDVPTVAEFNARTLATADYATAVGQATIAGYIDTEIATILAAVDTEIAAIKAQTDKLSFTLESATNYLKVDLHGLRGSFTINDAARFPNVT